MIEMTNEEKEKKKVKVKTEESKKPVVVRVGKVNKGKKKEKEKREEKGTEEKEKRKENERLNKRFMWTFAFLGYIVSAFIILAILKLSGVKWDIMQITQGIILVHFIISWFNIVGKKGRGAVYFFERPLYNAGRGIHFVPKFVCTLDKKTRTYFEDELPANPEKIYRVERNKADFVPIELQKEGYRPPLRVNFSGLTIKEQKMRQKIRQEGEFDFDDPFEERITAEVPGIIIWRIVDLIMFTETIGSEEAARVQMGDVFTSMMMTELSRITFRKFLDNKKKYDANLEDSLKKFTETWGIQIISARTKEYRGSRELNILIQRIAEAKALKRADALRGKGLGDKEKAILKGRTEGLLHMAKELCTTPEYVLSMETSRDIAKNVDNLILAGGKGGYTDLIGMVAAGAAALPSGNKTPKKVVDVVKKKQKEGES